MTEPLPPCVFISYSHDADDHRTRVLGLSERLRADGIETILDRYVERGSPPEGWPRWMLNGLEKATHVLCVCTDTYYRRFRGREVPGKGKGVDWEGAIITQSLYDARSVSSKFIPVLFAGSDAPYVPEPLRGQTFHVMDCDAGYEALYDALLDQSGVVPRPVGTLKRKPRATGQPLSFAPASPAVEANPSPSESTRKIARTQLDKHAPRVLFGRDTELEALDAAWAKGTLNVYTLVAWGGAGKTSLVFHWAQTRFAAKGWPGVERYFDWSFYSQGTGESRQTSADLLIARALAFFGDPDPTVGGPHERGERLAGLIRRHRTLLILDGIEPLQYPPNDPQAGRLKDQALDALLRELAADNPGLVVITTREHLTDVDKLANTEEQKLDKLSKDAAVALLRDLDIVGTDEELHAAWQDAGGHALTLSLLGRFIVDAYEDRDIRHYREVKFEAADEEHQGRSAFKVMIAYERWLKSGGPKRQRELAVLRLTGLFDRPMAKGCLQALRAAPVIPGLTDALVTLTEQQWNFAVTRLSKVDLLSVSADAIDAHPLIREYFAAQLQREQPEAFRAAHSRLFDYLCENTPHRPDGIDGLAPLYEAVTHGCLAGRQQEACDKVYVDRILRGTNNDGFYSTNKLGAIGADLAAVAAFFDAPWDHVSPNLTAARQSWLLNQAAVRLFALGRLNEALQPMRVSGEMDVEAGQWKGAAISYSNLSELEVKLGRLPDAVTDARQSITHADQSGDAFQRLTKRTSAADALHQSGQRMEAGSVFAEAERMQQKMQPQFDVLYSLQGFRYCDWLLATAEKAAWQQLLHQPLSNSASQISGSLAEIERRATTTLAWVTPQNWLLDIALDHLTLARVGLIRAILANPLPQPTLDLPHVAAAVNGLRAAGQMDDLPRGLLTAALYHFVRGEHGLALKLLAEARQIAERGPMPLFLADIHLTRARLAACAKGEGGWMKVDANAELAQAAQLIHELGYGRRDQELADAEAAIGGSR
jgi:TIR domain